MATMPAASIPKIYDDILDGFASKLAEDAKVEHDDDAALMQPEIGPLAARDGTHGEGLERFDIELLDKTAKEVRAEKAGIESDLAEAARLLADGTDRLTLHLAAVKGTTKEDLTNNAVRCRSEQVSKLGTENGHLKDLMHQTEGIKAILLKSGRCRQSISQMTADQAKAEYLKEEKSRIQNREKACLDTAAKLQKTQDYCANLEKIKGELAVCGHVDSCKERAKDKLSAVNRMVAERRHHIETMEALEAELCTEYDRAMAAEKQDKAVVRDLLERLLAANKALRSSRMRKHMVDRRLKALRENVKKEKEEMEVVVHESNATDLTYTNGVGKIEELRKDFLAARQSKGREGVEHVQPAALEEGLNISLALNLLRRAQDSKSKQRLALVEKKDDVQCRLDEAIRRREDPATASEEARMDALHLPDEKAELEESIEKCDEETRKLRDCEKAGEQVRRLLSSFSDFGLEMPWVELEKKAEIEADACFENFPGLFKTGNRSQTRESVAASSSSGTEGQLALVGEDMKELFAKMVKEQVARQMAQLEAQKKAAKRRAREQKASTSSTRAASPASGSWILGEPRFEGEAHSGESGSSNSSSDA